MQLGSSDLRLAKLAEVLVNYSLEIQPGQLVSINAPLPATPLTEQLFVAVLRAGGHPIVRVSPPDLQELFLEHASDEQLQYVNPLATHEADIVDARIGIWADENTRSLTNADPAKVALVSKARRPILQRIMDRAARKEMKWVGAQYPTAAHAQDAEMSLREYATFVFKAGLLDHPDPVAAWKQVRERQQKLVDLLHELIAKGETEYRVVAPNGTDLRMDVAGRTWINCAGDSNFPDGEVFTGPVVESVNGTVAFSFPAVHLGRECDGVRLTFRDGVVVDAQADKGEDFLIKMLDQDDGARRLGECAIGTNYGITRYTRNTLFDEKIGGTVHFALGAGYPETGNTNESGLHWDMVVDLRPGGTITLGGEIISENGRFRREDFPQPIA